VTICVDGDADTTLLIRLPNGSWICDDDSGGGNSPSLTISAVSGISSVWVGTFQPGGFRPVVALCLTEL
jgi:hypothetical protein